MAEEKKGDKKPEKKAPGLSDAETSERIIGILFFLMMLGAVATALLDFIDNIDAYATGGSLWARISEYFMDRIWPKWKFFAVVVSGLSIAGIIYNKAKLAAIDAAEYAIFGHGGLVAPSLEVEESRWQRILNLVNSEEPSNWRLAVIEADVMLEDVLRSKGYAGEGIGDMLKSANKEDFLSLDDAWEAHKVRNRVAHSGQVFELSEREAKRVIALFEKVFLEFGAI